MDIVVDTYAWVEVLRGSEKGEKAEEYISMADSVYTPSVVLAELARKMLREGVCEEEVRQDLNIIAQLSTIVYIDLGIAVEAGKAWLELRDKARREKLSPPSLFDAIVLASARVLAAKVLTGDRHFKGLPETLWIGD